MGTNDQPPPPFEPNPGYRWEATPEGDDWRVIEQTDCSVQCHRTLGRDGNKSLHRCPNAAVVMLDRRHKRGRRLWHYCADHMYGRWIEDGIVMHWRLVKNDDN